MTHKEQQIIDKLHTLLSDLRNENSKFREDIKEQVSSLEEKTNKKHMPIYLEEDILKSVQLSIDTAIKEVLQKDYNSPLKRLITEVVNENSKEIKEIISDGFTQVIRKDEFKQSIVSAFSHKISRSIISNNDGLFDKVSNELKQDAIFKSKMSIAVSNVVEECLNERK